MKKLMALFGERGASSIEYAIIAAVIAMAIVVGATSLGQMVGHIYNVVGNSIPK